MSEAADEAAGAEEAAAGEMAAEEPVVVAEEVVKRYFDGGRRVLAIDGVSLEVAAGELVVLMGPSGSGKTTLLGHLGGLITPTKGDVKVAGRSVVHMRDHHRTAWRRRHVGVVFQELMLVPGMSLLENVLLPLAPLGGAGSGARRGPCSRVVHARTSLLSAPSRDSPASAPPKNCAAPPFWP